MSLKEFIQLEAEALGYLRAKDPEMVWKAIECGAAEKMRLYAENHNYQVNVNDLLNVIWTELCDKLAPAERNV